MTQYQKLNTCLLTDTVDSSRQRLSILGSKFWTFLIPIKNAGYSC